MRTRLNAPLLMCAMLFCASLAGCLGGEETEEENSVIDLVVYYDTTSGPIEEVIQNNQQVSETGVDVTFDFSYTKSSCLLYTSPSPRDRTRSRMPSSA